MSFYVFLILTSLMGLSSSLQYTDSLVAPTPADHFIRLVTFRADGDRTYTCDPKNDTSVYSLKSFDYNLYDAETDPGRIINLGKHILLLQRDSEGGNSVFYTANNTFTYWVGKTTMLIQDPLARSPLDLTLEQSLRTEASEPKKEASKYDMGVGVYFTRFGAKGGNLPAGTRCTGDRVVRSEAYYSLFKQIV
ncbi:hypothetical protein GQ53DRAFT_816873 [Thozetella sp. PMI_491]|nr:hypothetical protein GQ53DRAFT_816873 [Thozetella sp. PMI_491]